MTVKYIDDFLSFFLKHLLSRQFNQVSSSTVKNINEFKTFSIKSNNNAYDIIGDIHSNERKFTLY
jgi:hypothetical protein